MFTRSSAVSAAVVVMSLAPAAVSAGILDSPLPLIAGLKTKYIYTVTGVTSATGGLETVFHCTSMDKKPFKMGIEIFKGDGTGPLNDVAAGNGEQDFNPGQSRTIVTSSNVDAFDEDKNITALGSVDQGSARIVSTSSNIVCTAMLVDPNNAPPTSMVSLNVFAKTKQKGN